MTLEQQRLENIKEWLDKVKHLLSQDKIKITLNMKGSNITPEIVSYHEPIKQK